MQLFYYTETPFVIIKKKSLSVNYPSKLHSPKLCSIIPVATKVHVILRSSVVLIWTHNIIELV
jgi:hypothetical protein